jgi:hypothetical protein
MVYKIVEPFSLRSRTRQYMMRLSGEDCKDPMALGRYSSLNGLAPEVLSAGVGLSVRT